MGKKRVVITGVGVISPISIGREEFLNALKAGISGIKPITLFDTNKYKVKVAGEVKDFDPSLILGKRGLLDLDRATKLLLCSAQLALDESGLEINETNNADIGVAVGTTLGSLNSISRFNHESFTDGPRFANPSIFPSTVINSPASRVGIRFKITGFNSTVSTGMCSFIDALNYAYTFIDFNRVNAVVVGAVEDLSIQTFLGCYKLQYLSGLTQGHEPLSCPFDNRRDGILLGEGATTFIVEDLQTALKRKAPIYAEILGMGSCFDPGSYYKYTSNGHGMVRAMDMALKDAKLQAQYIDCIFANANSTKDADKIESKAIREVFCQNQGAGPLVTSVKSFLGEGFSVSGGFSLAAALGALRDNFIPPILNYSDKDPACDLNYVLNGNGKVPVSRAMINTFSPHGAASVLIVGKYR
ncbi:MAG: beta-ketoacyl-[acyl-carrier-protein] synthase family protein [Candidatus Omnitrophica bacterium]|nr:beta-ketoacyl-[acyl-carrier-protein] synthase family protein [Candidatus Omnitrophota bacterium]